MKTASDFNLDAYATDIAVDIFTDHCLDRDEAFDIAWQPVDGSEWIIYHAKSHEICANCNTDQGEQFIEDTGGFPVGSTYDSMASLIAYSELMARVNEALETLFDIAAANDQAAIELVNDFVESQVEYETRHQDAGDNYAHMLGESWDDQRTRELESALNAETRDFSVEDHFDPASYKSAWEVLGVDSRWVDLESEILSDLALDAFTMQSGSIHGPFKGDIVLDAYAVQEIEVDLNHLGLDFSTLTRIEPACDCYISGTHLAYESTDAVWFAVLDVEAFNALIADHFDA
tara:strand:+ start:221 stop:1087 length:867 start_codon:yes stop_codon:yes gene_type:complete